MISERCWCRHVERWHQHGVCMWCARNERTHPGPSISIRDAPPRHQFATEMPAEEWEKRVRWFEENFGRKPGQQQGRRGQVAS